VALVPGPLHFLLSRRPVRHAADFRGLKIGVTASVVGERSLRELGAVPVALARGASISGLDGVEANLGELAAHYVDQAPYLSGDAPLGPAVKVVFANRRTWSTLGQGERVILRQAADRAFARTLSAARDDDRAAVAQLCDGGVRLVTFGAQGRDELRLAIARVYDAVRRRTDARAGLQAVDRARAGRDVPQPLACKAAPKSPVPALAGTFMWTMHRGEPGSEYVDSPPTLRLRAHTRQGARRRVFEPHRRRYVCERTRDRGHARAVARALPRVGASGSRAGPRPVHQGVKRNLRDQERRTPGSPERAIVLIGAGRTPQRTSRDRAERPTARSWIPLTMRKSRSSVSVLRTTSTLASRSA
jgi:hypothetical protein